MAKKRAPKNAKTRAPKKRQGAKAASPTKARRRRLVGLTLGRRIDDAYLAHPEIRKEVEAEAASGDPDALITPEMLEQLRELIGQERRVIAVPQAQAAARGARAETAPALGPLVLENVAAAAPEAPSAAARGGVAAPRGLEVFATPRAFFSTDQVVFVPGFLASSLSDTAPNGFGLVWVDPTVYFRDQLGALQLAPYDGMERDLMPAVRVNPTGPLPYFYDILRLALEVHRYTVEVFAVDWRKDLEISAGLLAARLRALAGQSSRPIHLIAHSQGALVARRALQLLGPTEAPAIIKHLVLLGPANYGSFSAALGIAGNNSLMPLVRKLAVEPKQGFQAIMASWTGAYQLLPFDPARTPWVAENDYSTLAFWKQPIDADRLGKFYGWAGKIDTSFMNGRTAVILGDNFGQPTTGGVVYQGSLLVDAVDYNLPGDGTVTHSCSVLPGTRTYLASQAEHSMLATYRKVIDAVRDVLADRSVSLPEVSSNPADHLKPMPAAARGLAAPGVRPAAATKKAASRDGKAPKGRKAASKAKAAPKKKAATKTKKKSATKSRSR